MMQPLAISKLIDPEAAASASGQAGICSDLVIDIKNLAGALMSLADSDPSPGMIAILAETIVGKADAALAEVNGARGFLSGLTRAAGE